MASIRSCADKFHSPEPYYSAGHFALYSNLDWASDPTVPRILTIAAMKIVSSRPLFVAMLTLVTVRSSQSIRMDRAVRQQDLVVD
jgi:hypothetical protein